MSSMIKIPKKITSEILEDILKKIYAAPKSVDLAIPTSIEYRGFGIIPNLYLVLFTWMRNKNGNVILSIRKDDDNAIKNFACDFYGYIVLSTLWRHCDIINEEKESIKLQFKEYTSLMHFNIESLSSELPKESIMIPCFDHYSNEKGLPHWFYPYDFLFCETPSNLENSIYHIFNNLTRNYRGRLNKNLSDTFDNVVKIIWELLKNTDEHAKRDYLDKAKLLPSSRGLFMKIQRNSKSVFIESTNHLGLKKYYASAFNNEEHNFILEISVFDSGPGLVKRFMGDNWSIDENISNDIDAVRKCLIKGQTSVITSQGKNKGYGLDEVLRLLDIKRGFLKIRTGRVSIYRDLIETPYKITQEPNEIELIDWNKNSSSEYSEMSNTEGTLITLAYPLI